MKNPKVIFEISDDGYIFIVSIDKIKSYNFKYKDLLEVKKEVENEIKNKRA